MKLILLIAAVLMSTVGISAKDLTASGLLLYREPKSTNVVAFTFSSFAPGVSDSGLVLVDGQERRVWNSGILAKLEYPPSDLASVSAARSETMIQKTQEMAARFPEYARDINLIGEKWQQAEALRAATFNQKLEELHNQIDAVVNAPKRVDAQTIDSPIPGGSYSSDLDDITSLGVLRGITPIGDLGDIESVLDLRGFIPISAASRSKEHRFWKWDVFQWYKIPLIADSSFRGVTSRCDSLGRLIPLTAGIAYIYYGKLDDTIRTKLLKAKVAEEDELTGDNLQWAKFSYSLAHSSGQNLYKSLEGSSSGFVGAEPVVILLTRTNAIIILNFRYSDLNRASATGQVLCGFEFSRSLKEYKSYYTIYTTDVLGRTENKILAESTPLVTKLIAEYFLGK